MTLVVVIAGWLAVGMAALVMFALGASAGRRRGYEEGFVAGRVSGYAAAVKLRRPRPDLRIEHVLPDVEGSRVDGDSSR